MQLDVKHVIPVRILIEAMFLAKAGRIALLDEMENMVQESLGGLKHRWSTKRSAPRVEIIRFDPSRKRDLIGPGGAVLRQIEDKYGVSLGTKRIQVFILFVVESRCNSTKSLLLSCYVFAFSCSVIVSIATKQKKRLEPRWPMSPLWTKSRHGRNS